MDESFSWFYEHSSSEGNSTAVCQEYQTDKYRFLVAVAASMGAVSLVASVIVILLILILKKYIHFVQRLILYLSIATALNAVALILNFSKVVKHNGSKPMDILCEAVAFIYQSTRWSITLAYACLTFTLLIAAVFNTTGERLEIVYVTGTFVFPLLFNWVPFLFDSYGPSGPWCSIRTENYDFDDDGNVSNCSTHNIGVTLSFGLWYIPNYALLNLLLIAYIVVMINIMRKRRHWKGIYSTASDVHSERKNFKELVMTIILYPLVFFIISIFSLLNRIYILVMHEPNFYLWLLHAIFSPLQGGFVAVVYALDIETVRRLSLKECFAHLFHRKTNVREYLTGQGPTDSLAKLITKENSDNVIGKYGSTSPTNSSSLLSRKGQSLDSGCQEEDFSGTDKDEMRLQNSPTSQICDSSPQQKHSQCSDDQC